MLLTENIVLRVREWLDRDTEEPDLVLRYRRLWSIHPRMDPGGAGAATNASGKAGPWRAEPASLAR